MNMHSDLPKFEIECGPLQHQAVVKMNGQRIENGLYRVEILPLDATTGEVTRVRLDFFAHVSFKGQAKLEAGMTCVIGDKKFRLVEEESGSILDNPDEIEVPQVSP